MVTDLQGEDERNPLVILVVDLLITFHPGSYSVVNEVLVQCSLDNYKIAVATFLFPLNYSNSPQSVWGE